MGAILEATHLPTCLDPLYPEAEGAAISEGKALIEAFVAASGVAVAVEDEAGPHRRIFHQMARAKEMKRLYLATRKEHSCHTKNILCRTTSQGLTTILTETGGCSGKIGMCSCIRSGTAKGESGKRSGRLSRTSNRFLERRTAGSINQESVSIILSIRTKSLPTAHIDLIASRWTCISPTKCPCPLDCIMLQRTFAIIGLGHCSISTPSMVTLKDAKIRSFWVGSGIRYAVQT
jgi:hypothetical protein